MTAIVAVSSLQIAFVVVAIVGVGVTPMFLALRTMAEEIQGLGSDGQVQAVAAVSDDAPPFG